MRVREMGPELELTIVLTEAEEFAEGKEEREFWIWNTNNEAIKNGFEKKERAS